MANSKANTTGWSTGDPLTAAQANALDAGQVAALTRSGTTALTGNATISGGGFGFSFDLSDNAASFLGISLGTQHFDIQCFGAGTTRLAANKITLTGSSGWPILGTRTLTDKAVHYTPTFDPTSWAYDILGSVVASVNTVTSCNLILGNLPPGLTLTGFRVDVLGATSGSLPGTMPTVGLYRFAAGAYVTATETVGTVSDTSANNAAYTTAHPITKTGLTHTVDAGSCYVLTIVNGYGGGAAVGFTVYRPFISGTLSTLQTALAHGHHLRTCGSFGSACGPKSATLTHRRLLLGA